MYKNKPLKGQMGIKPKKMRVTQTQSKVDAEKKKTKKKPTVDISKAMTLARMQTQNKNKKKKPVPKGQNHLVTNNGNPYFSSRLDDTYARRWYDNWRRLRNSSK